MEGTAHVRHQYVLWEESTLHSRCKISIYLFAILNLFFEKLAATTPYKMHVISTTQETVRKQDSQKQRFDMETATMFKGGCQGDASNLGGTRERSNKLSLGIACKTSLCQRIPSFKTNGSNLQDSNCTCTHSVNKECS